MPKVALTTLGCKVNQFETEVMEGLFKKRNYETVSFADQADFYIINTCSVTHLGEKKSRQLIRRAQRLNPKAIIAVTGCYSQIAPEQIQAIDGVNVVIGTKERSKIVDLVERAAAEHNLITDVTDIMQATEFEDIPLFDMPGRTRAFLKIQEGCSNFCSYCIIPYARGPLRSRKLSSIKAEAEKLVEAGFKEIVLTGIHLGAYGRDFLGNINLVDAARLVLTIPNLKRLRLGSLESIELSKDLFDLICADDRFSPHLHLPLQAGQDDILKAMNRHYTTEEFGRLITYVEESVPGIAISTDIIVGFPGETDEMFEQGLAFAKSMNFAKMHVFPYSKRAGTPAATMKNQVPEIVKKQRVHIMQKMADAKAAAFHEGFIGSDVSVLFEANHDGVFDGLTGNYIRVYVNDRIDCGEIYQVHIEKIYRDGLWGKIC
ncbi:tRNA (N(6)-L-threonylcarbamoyladenosine(37)-C(2))-methylthiotransferase MtaB [Propionispira raffinosivorans]|uniref:tRNA (N(6)-L-threonylcarbamoyladenosine(37)-C(2))- methylthiotransferase MtaB n=1 Tax=Propionispira raffinosivorans TaxID=86959 RepID=UPI00035F4C53|nr:tRNA (N(6)-L-threonylcarbamoyladenosine(37)-C(2))-methylthiotransferase MtaB [Propionispira raffinosivorans]